MEKLKVNDPKALAAYVKATAQQMGRVVRDADLTERERLGLANLGEPIVAGYVPVMDRAPVTRDGGPVCEACNSMRFVVGANGRAVACGACGTAKGWAVEKLAGYSSANGRAAAQTFGNFREPTLGDGSVVKAFRTVRAWAAVPSGWVVLYGDKGTGKSHLLAAAYNHVIGNRIGTAIFVSMKDLAESLKACMGEDGEEPYSTRMKRYQTCAILMIDDLGTEVKSAWSDALYFEILDYRYRNQLPTLLTSNLDVLDASGENFDPRVVSRWQEVGFSEVIRMRGEDYRKRRNK